MAAFIQIYLFCVCFILLIKSGIENLIFSVGKVSPIVPVHANSMSVGFIFSGFSSSSFCFSVNIFDKSSAKSLSPLKPFLPVNAFAFLVLTNKAFIFLVLIFKFHFIFSEINLD